MTHAPKTKKPINQNTSPKAVGSWQLAVGRGQLARGQERV